MMEANAKAKPNTKKSLTQEKSKLARDIKSKKAELDVLNSKIGDLEKLSNKKDSLKSEVDELTQQKRELGKLTIQQQSVSQEVESLTAEKKKLDAFIKKNKPIKETLEKEVNELDARKADIEGKVEVLVANGKKAQANVNQLKEEKSSLEDSIASLKNDYNLFPRELKDMSKDATLQLRKYASLATLSALGVVAVMALLITLLILPIIDNGFASFIGSQPGIYAFYSILVTKVLVFGALIFFVLIFLNTTRGFISQYIKSRNRLSSLRLSDYMIDRVQNGSSQISKEELKLLHTYLPQIIDQGDSYFDKSKSNQRKKSKKH